MTISVLFDEEQVVLYSDHRFHSASFKAAHNEKLSKKIENLLQTFYEIILRVYFLKRFLNYRSLKPLQTC